MILKTITTVLAAIGLLLLAALWLIAYHGKGTTQSPAPVRTPGSVAPLY